MSYHLLQKNDKGFYEVDGRDTRLEVIANGVTIGAFDDAPLHAKFKIGHDTYYIDTGAHEGGRIMEVSRLELDEEGNVVKYHQLDCLEIMKGHPINRFLIVSGVSLHDEFLDR
ncbi:hypothetical protein FDI21_gp053 [Pseudomonas phage Noxifer]|uniref:Uncharacterized protein n=1 Tax=Pseudomonas phage Noxifer TaxID=2006684 RepID=A0A1Y0SX96_9CAUD|nr:hypothetical protein FDI21_gp053 [Pseudomonas phage Noxifer]ARV77224.1 hypothetical protein NOXIFER_53 [Pseudomonas phage Noxifer]